MDQKKVAQRIAELVRSGKTAVLGFGKSNIPLVGVLCSMGADVTVYDQKERASLAPEAERFEDRGVSFVCGPDAFDSIPADVIFRSPGIREDIPGIRDALSRGALLTSEMEFFLCQTEADTIGVTGSDGKTTTTTLIHLFLTEQEKEEKSGRRILVGGNIGFPLIEHDELKKGDRVVVELSSFQLQTMAFPPRTAVVTNISPNHLNWHKDMREYVAAKSRIFKPDYTRRLVVNADNPYTKMFGHSLGENTVYFSSTRHHAEEILPEGEEGTAAVFERDGMIYFGSAGEEEPVFPAEAILLPGKHNLENYMAAIGAVWGLVSPGAMDRVARSFTGVPHRLELVREWKGIRFYNSSIDSSPTRSCAALSAIREKPAVICGGRDKHVPFSPLADALYQRASAVVLTGEAAPQIRQALEESPLKNDSLMIFSEPAFDAAVELAARTAEKNGIPVVLLSPACTSFDCFNNFEERGERFRQIVRNLKD